MILSFKLICEWECIYSSQQVSKESFLLLLSKITLLAWKGGAKTCPFSNVPHIFILFFDIFLRSICSFPIVCWPLFLPPLPKIMFFTTIATWDITMCSLRPSKNIFFAFAGHCVSAILVHTPRTHPSAALVHSCGRSNVVQPRSDLRQSSLLQQPPFCLFHSCLLWPNLLQRCSYVDVIFPKLSLELRINSLYFFHLHMPFQPTSTGLGHAFAVTMVASCSRWRPHSSFCGAWKGSHPKCRCQHMDGWWLVIF